MMHMPITKEELEYLEQFENQNIIERAESMSEVLKLKREIKNLKIAGFHYKAKKLSKKLEHFEKGLDKTE